jgi:hypothetical protein
MDRSPRDRGLIVSRLASRQFFFVVGKPHRHTDAELTEEKLAT